MQHTMIQVKSFSLDNYQEFNDFVKTTRPRGEKGITYNQTHIFVFYESGEPMDRYDQLSKLQFKLGEAKENILEYRVQLRNSEKQLKVSIAKQEIDEKTLVGLEGKVKHAVEKRVQDNKNLIAQYEQKVAADKGMIKIKELEIEAIQELAAEIEKE